MKKHEQQRSLSVTDVYPNVSPGHFPYIPKKVYSSALR